jgi:hypothetical protein
MHRIDGAGNVGNMFVLEDPTINRPPTEITADFMNAVQQEIAGVIEWSGLTLNKANNAQLLQALQAKFASVSPSGDYGTKLGIQQNQYDAANASAVGSADAIVADFFPAVAALANGQTLIVRANAANATATPTFTPANGVIAAKTIVKGDGLPLVAGDIKNGGYWIELRYDLTLDKWVLINPATGILPFVVQMPIGSIIHTAMPAAPTGFLKANGAVISRTTYASLFAAIGTTFGVGDGASTFGIPDLRGEFIRGYDDGRGVDVGRAFGLFQKGSEVGFEDTNANMLISPIVGSQVSWGYDPASTDALYMAGFTATPYPSDNGVGQLNFAGAWRGTSRPRNIALLACIRYL